MKGSWDVAIQRASQLAATGDGARELLTFYAALLAAQKAIYEALRRRPRRLVSGSLQHDLPEIRPLLPQLLRAVEANGPDALALAARDLLRAGQPEVDGLLLEYWQTPSDVLFFAKGLLQPYAHWLAESGVAPADRGLARAPNSCPFCAGKPQLSVLKSSQFDSPGGGRSLLCSTCLTTWPFRRVVCAHCGEERPAKLGYFHAPEFGHIRVEACDTCGHYLKGIDLSRSGLAVPVVDEVAAAALDVWARGQGYAKIELNLVGL